MSLMIKTTNQLYVRPIYACSSDALYRSLDGGQTADMLPAPHSTTQDIVFVTPMIGFAASGLGLSRTTDGGMTWSLFDSSSYMRSISMADDSVGWAVGVGPTMLKTTDGWESYSAVTLPSIGLSPLRSVKAVSPLVAYACGENGVILKTTDGSTWTKQTSGTSVDLLSIDAFPDGMRAVACGYSQYPLTGSCLYTDDGGASWSGASGLTYPELNKVACLGQSAVLAIAYTSLHRSIDSGKTYVDLRPQIGGVAPRAIYAKGTEAMLIGSRISGAVLRSTDSGSTWSVINSPFPGANLITASLGYISDGPASIIEVEP